MSALSLTRNLGKGTTQFPQVPDIGEPKSWDRYRHRADVLTNHPLNAEERPAVYFRTKILPLISPSINALSRNLAILTLAENFCKERR